MSLNLKFRSATINDVEHLVLLFDAASRHISSYFWSQMSDPGQSYFEVGRTRMRTKTDSVTYFANWVVAEVDGVIAGAFNGYRIAKPYDQGDISNMLEVIVPLVKLEAVAEDTWYLLVASVFPEHRGKGIGIAMLEQCMIIARNSGANRMSLTTESANERAHRV